MWIWSFDYNNSFLNQPAPCAIHGSHYFDIEYGLPNVIFCVAFLAPKKPGDVISLLTHSLSSPRLVQVAEYGGAIIVSAYGTCLAVSGMADCLRADGLAFLQVHIIAINRRPTEIRKPIIMVAAIKKEITRTIE